MDIPFDELKKNGRINIDDGIKNGTIFDTEIYNVGSRNKMWFNNSSYMFKEIWNDSYEDYAELIASELAKEFGIPSAYYDLAIYQGKNGVITKNFVNEDIGEELIIGKDIVNTIYNLHIKPIKYLCKKYISILNTAGCDFSLANINEIKLDSKIKIIKSVLDLYKQVSLINSSLLAKLINVNVDNLTDKEVNYYLEELNKIFLDFFEMYEYGFEEDDKGYINGNFNNNLYDLWSLIELYFKYYKLPIENANDIIKTLADLFIFDILTSQGDRHYENWGLIINNENGSVRFSPIFDNSNICNLNRSKAIKTINTYIDGISKRKDSDPAKERTMQRLKEAIYHEKSLLDVNTNDLKQKNTEKMMNFAKVSSSEIIDLVKNKLDLLTQDVIDNIFTRIERRIKVKIPDEIKRTVKTTIQININEFRIALNKGMIK